MASKKFHRKIREVADQVMEEGEEFRSGLAGMAGQGVTAKAGGWGQGAQMARAGGFFTGKMWNALVILGDRNLYLIRAPVFKAYDVKEVVLKAPETRSRSVQTEGSSESRLAITTSPTTSGWKARPRTSSPTRASAPDPEPTSRRRFDSAGPSKPPGFRSRAASGPHRLSRAGGTVSRA
jgi:hypothetical protein